ncbi:MAG: porin [Beijerinckiaceae bacterium]
MKVAKSLLLGSAAVLATVAGAQAADLPTRKAAPVQYVKICDAYGAGFFYIPGTDTCLRVGGLVLADWAVSNTPDRLQASGAATVAGINAGTAGAYAGLGFGLGGALPSSITQGKNRDAVASLALGRVELDARTQSPWGTVRAFLRVESQFGSGQTAATGAGGGGYNGFPAYAGYGSYASGKEITYLNKAFIQFAGITMGRIQSMFDFYADAVGYTGLRGSNQTVNGLAYTLTMGGGFSATLSLEDSVSHRSQTASTVLIGNSFITGAAVSVGASGASVVGIPGTAGAASAQLNGTRLPDIVANLRLDQPWGSAQVMGAIHQIRQGLYNVGGAAAGGFATGLGVPSAVSPTPALGLFNFNNTSSIGFAVGAGVKFNLDMLAPGDVLWLQAIYAKGAIGYTNGSNMAFVNGFNNTNGYGIGLARVSSGNGWNGSGFGDVDCVWTMAGSCDKSQAVVVTAALRHYWTPTISSTLTGAWWRTSYSANALNPAAAGAAFINTGAVPFLSGWTNYQEFQVATGLEWNPVKNFGIGAEVTWQHGITSRPVGLASDLLLQANGLPAFKSSADLVRGRVRMYRAF